ncbi:MAG: FtsW/RodA/SpoVE family cell cycle protein [Anaerostipes sp.]|nr:FtsW/RodA/SpoVE family cell cycle protein [Anaerostipes sp.]
MFRKFRWKNYNFLIVANVFLIACMGLVFIHSANASFVAKQGLGVIMCFGIMMVVSLIDFNFFLRNASILYVLNLVLLIGVRFIGKDVNGAKRWFSLGPLGTFQVSEISKIIMIIVVAAFIVKNEYEMDDLRTLGKLGLICLVPLFLILKQPDLSTTLDIVFVILCMVFIGGISSKYIFRAITVGVPLFILFFWYIQTPGQILLKPHQVARVLSFINPSAYANSTALQTSNSVMAIGSGGLFGKGFGANTISNVSASDVNLVSEQQTDFIFSVIGEEFGFVGCLFVILCIAFLVFQIIKVARKSETFSGYLIAVGIAGYFAIQSFINIGVATGAMPNTGLPLPFISYGISSLLTSSIGIGLVLNIHLQSKKY